MDSSSPYYYYDSDVEDEAVVDTQLSVGTNTSAPNSMATLNQWRQTHESTGGTFSFFEDASVRIDGQTLEHHLYLYVRSGSDLGDYRFDGVTRGRKKDLKHELVHLVFEYLPHVSD